MLSNATNVVGKWKLFHVADGTEVSTLTEKDELANGTTAEFRGKLTLDDPTVFSFDVAGGTLMGPTAEATTQACRALPLGPALPAALPHADRDLYSPSRIEVTFAPKLNRFYRSRFVIYVDGGDALQFECEGCGSYDEQDDFVEQHEA